jgi:REP element-mobilizing transposase RayT
MYHPRKHNRQSIRLKGYDYSKPGYYFVTICVADRYCLFGEILDEEMHLNEYGKIAKAEWLRTENLRDNVCLDEFVVMPNHVHGIIKIIDKNSSRGVSPYAPAAAKKSKNKFRSPSNNLGAMVRGYKSTVTKQINKLNNQPGDKVWQRNYYDHIIRNRHELNRIRKYIQDNPKNWENDTLSNS